MRIQVTGDCPSARAVRTGLAAEGFAVTRWFPSYEIQIEATSGAIPEVDGVDSELERQVVNCIAGIANTDILLRRQGEVRSDQKIRILIPQDEAKAALVEQAIIKGFALATTSRPNRRSTWFAR